jgi:putative polyhydroxyalkanoate system protein
MSHIDIRRSHNLDPAHARAAAESVAARLNEEYQLHHYWQGDTLHFKRSGVDGHMEVGVDELRLHVKLGFLLSPWKTRFEQAIHRHLDKLLNSD